MAQTAMATAAVQSAVATAAQSAVASLADKVAAAAQSATLPTPPAAHGAVVQVWDELANKVPAQFRKECSNCQRLNSLYQFQVLRLKANFQKRI